MALEQYGEVAINMYYEVAWDLLTNMDKLNKWVLGSSQSSINWIFSEIHVASRASFRETLISYMI